jgi:molecular chaperone GrpE
MEERTPTNETPDFETPANPDEAVIQEEKAASDANKPEPGDPQAELLKFQSEAAEWKDKYLRIYAEFENFRTRNAREKTALILTATEGLMKDLLPVADDFERSLKVMESASDVESIREGVELVYHKFSGILAQKGLKAMESIGKPFDADFHEAVSQVPAPDASQKGLVIDEVEKGYFLNEKTIRFARVIIGS